MSIFRNDTLGSWTRGGQAIVHNLRMTTQVFFQTIAAGIVLWLTGAVWYALERSSDYDRFVLVKLGEATLKESTAPGTNDPVLFKTPKGREYWTSADWLLESELAKLTLQSFEAALLQGSLVSGVFALAVLAWAWFYFTRTGRGLGSLSVSIGPRAAGRAFKPHSARGMKFLSMRG